MIIYENGAVYCSCPPGRCPPGKIFIMSLGATFVSLTWETHRDLSNIPHSYSVTWKDSSTSQSITSDENQVSVHNLRAGTDYVFSVKTTMKGTDFMSQPVSINICTSKSMPICFDVNYKAILYILKCCWGS